MPLLEFLILGLYLAMLLVGIVGIQLLEEVRLARKDLTVEEGEEEIAQADFEEPESEEEHPSTFNPETEQFTMSENPMLRHRNVEQATAMEMVD
jgi:hypothetical protein